MVGDAPSIAIIGAGVAGLTCGMELAAFSTSCTIFDKGRGLGGRLATRRAEGGFQFDHGAPFLAAKSAKFLSLLQQAEAAGAAAPWSPEGTEPGFVGVPGMTGLAKYMAAGLDIRKGTRIEGLMPDGEGWILQWEGGERRFDIVILTTPALQTVDLLPDEHPLAGMLDAVRMDPCLTLMVGISGEVDVARGLTGGSCEEIAWMAKDSAKPGRLNARSFVAHASTSWSERHLELNLDEVAARFLPMVLARLDLPETDAPAYVSAHRWRYARASHPLGQAYLANDARTLFVGGDWCLGNSAEHAWQSGQAIAAAIGGAIKA